MLNNGHNVEDFDLFFENGICWECDNGGEITINEGNEIYTVISVSRGKKSVDKKLLKRKTSQEELLNRLKEMLKVENGLDKDSLGLIIRQTSNNIKFTESSIEVSKNRQFDVFTRSDFLKVNDSSYLKKYTVKYAYVNPYLEYNKDYESLGLSSYNKHKEFINTNFQSVIYQDEEKTERLLIPNPLFWVIERFDNINNIKKLISEFIDIQSVYPDEIPAKCVDNVILTKPQKGYFVNAPRGLNLRENPNSTSKVVTKLEYNDKVNLIEKSEIELTIKDYDDKGNFIKNITDSWYKVSFEKEDLLYTGYVFGGYLENKNSGRKFFIQYRNPCLNESTKKYTNYNHGRFEIVEGKIYYEKLIKLPLKEVDFVEMPDFDNAIFTKPTLLKRAKDRETILEQKNDLGVISEIEKVELEKIERLKELAYCESKIINHIQGGGKMVQILVHHGNDVWGGEMFDFQHSVRVAFSVKVNSNCEIIDLGVGRNSVDLVRRYLLN